jgi:hypothetical protein
MLLRKISRWLLLGAGAVGLAAFAAEDSVTVPSYELTAVERKLFRELPAPEVPLAQGEAIAAGDLLRTGSRSSADILCTDALARFRLGAKTRARLASDAPGVLLDIEEGRLHALFGKLTGAASERVVTTPSAVLAVRGTEYGVEVDGKATTTVVVFSGEVEVVDRGRIGPPVLVGPGQYTEIRRGEPAQQPIPHQMGPGHWDQGRRPDEPPPMDTRDPDDHGFGSGADMGSGSPGSGPEGAGQRRGSGGGGPG